MREITKILRAVLVVMAMLLIVACIPQAEEEDDGEAGDNADAAGEDEAEAGAWSDNLTWEQVVKTMPVTVEISPAPTPEPVSENGISTIRLAQNAEELVAVVIEWSTPVHSDYVWNCVDCQVPSEDLWRVYEQNPETLAWDTLKDENGEDLVPEITTWKDTDGVDVIEYRVQFLYPWWFFNEYLKYFKVEWNDHNGDKIETVVTFLVCPSGQDMRITIHEASADAPSRLFAEYGYDSEDLLTHEVFTNEETSLLNLALPLTGDLPPLPANYPVKFVLKTDFSNPAWGFEPKYRQVERLSNSSFAKVEKIRTGLPSDVWARFRYSFEDLPLSKKAIEGYTGGTNEFDYNDVIFDVDVLKP